MMQPKSFLVLLAILGLSLARNHEGVALRGSVLNNVSSQELEVSFWGMFYNLLHGCPPHEHDCHHGHGHGHGGHSHSDGGSTPPAYDDTTDDTTDDASSYPVGVSNDTGDTVTPSSSVFTTASSASKAGIMFAGAGAAVVAVALVLRHNKGKNAPAITLDGEEGMRSDNGLVTNRLKSFGEFMKARKLEPQSEGFEMGNTSSDVDFVRVEN